MRKFNNFYKDLKDFVQQNLFDWFYLIYKENLKFK
jgi:hypothetical protein